MGDLGYITTLSILFDKPEEMLLKEKPSGIRTDKVFTLNSKYISIQSMKADDNRAYVYSGNSKKTYYYEKTVGAFIVHKYDDVLYYYNKRVGSKY